MNRLKSFLRAFLADRDAQAETSAGVEVETWQWRRQHVEGGIRYSEIDGVLVNHTGAAKDVVLAFSIRGDEDQELVETLIHVALAPGERRRFGRVVGYSMEVQGASLKRMDVEAVASSDFPLE